MTILDQLHPQGWPNGLFEVLWTLPDRHSYWCESKEQANAKAAELCAREDIEVFFHVGLSHAPTGTPHKTRPKHDEIQYLTALWADIDTGPFEEGGWPAPDIIVESGHGQHWYWLLPEPLRGNEDIQAMIEGWFLRLEEWGVPFDRAATDAARVLRWPGSVNRKDSENPRPVTLTSREPR